MTANIETLAALLYVAVFAGCKDVNGATNRAPHYREFESITVDTFYTRTGRTCYVASAWGGYGTPRVAIACE